MEEGIGTSSWDVGPFESSDGGETYMKYYFNIIVYINLYFQWEYASVMEYNDWQLRHIPPAGWNRTQAKAQAK